MTERDALLAAIYAHPDEDTPRLVFADWLDEHEEHARALLIREQYRVSLLNYKPEDESRAVTEILLANESGWLGVELPCRTRRQVWHERTANAVYGGCCDKFADHSPCGCLESSLEVVWRIGFPEAVRTGTIIGNLIAFECAKCSSIRSKAYISCPGCGRIYPGSPGPPKWLAQLLNRNPTIRWVGDRTMEPHEENGRYGWYGATGDAMILSEVFDLMEARADAEYRETNMRNVTFPTRQCAIDAFGESFATWVRLPKFLPLTRD